MNQPKTLAIYPLGNPSEAELLDELKKTLQSAYPSLSSLGWSEFSERAIDRFLLNESRHGNSGLSQNKHFSHLSSGEKRRALFSHLIHEAPEVLLLVSPLESLDPANRAYFQEELHKLSPQCWIIQVLHRPNFLLPWTAEELDFDLRYRQLAPHQNKARSTEFANAIQAKGLPEFAEQKAPQQFDSLIEMKGLELHYGNRCILQDIHWRVKTHEFWELSGPNGSGKSSLISLITGDNPQGYGQPYSLFGRKRGSGESVWEIKSHIGYFTPVQLQGFGGYQNALEVLLSGYYDSVGLYQLPSDRQLRIARQWLDLLQIPIKKAFRNLSQGQQRLVMTARAFLKQPPLLILDEPTWGLDPEQVALFVELVNLMYKESDASLIYVSHHPEQGLKPTHRIQLIPHEEGSIANTYIVE